MLATRHGKEEAIAPALRELAGLEVEVAAIDTDRFGTFTGEVERPAPPAQTARLKARAGMEESGAAIGLASEGAYGPHPEAAFVTSGLELIAFVDDGLGIELVEGIRTTSTNASRIDAGEVDERILEWAAGAGFPDHALTVRPSGGAREAPVFKGIREPGELKEAVGRCAARAPDGRACIETDMRAHVNPTRMAQIAVVARALGERLATPCPACAAPGFGAVEAVPGLPCGRCGLPTDWTAKVIHGCCVCEEWATLPRPDGLEVADPANCRACNP